MMNPNEGLKRHNRLDEVVNGVVRRMMNPNEGLKPGYAGGAIRARCVRRMMNPNEGLKLYLRQRGQAIEQSEG